ncbi:HEPN domain-containing protein [Cyclobacterium marinum]|uniref:HEPN domain-containing protein n=1 Tax=Cyclobacterium marinum TaxID=104 RepID=UPI0030D77C84|tara:strand:- start:36524 stop:37219 length:696 start_codon:yes stop_codon:yes gene_type:complete
MSYKKSQARIDFETGTKSLKQVAKKVSYKSSPLNYDQKLLIFQSSIFLMSAKIEEYTKVLIEKIIFNYKSKNAFMSKIPVNIRTKALIDNQLVHYKNFNHNTDERKLIEKINCAKSYYEILNPDNCFSNYINSENVIATNKYPSVKNIKILYFRIGINDIFNEVAKRGRKDYKSQLESFLSIREAIAHQEAPVLTYQDVERHLDNLVDLIRKIDRVVYSHIIKSSGEIFWN